MCALNFHIYIFEPPKQQPAKFQGFSEIYVEAINTIQLLDVIVIDVSMTNTFSMVWFLFFKPSVLLVLFNKKLG